jgi:hypothetical protein
MPDSPSGRRFALPPDVVLQLIDGDGLLLHLAREDVFALNATGARIAQLLADGMELDRVIDAVTTEFDVDRAEVAASAGELVDDLIARGLLRTIDH